jgi:hypothetical protein
MHKHEFGRTESVSVDVVVACSGAGHETQILHQWRMRNLTQSKTPKHGDTPKMRMCIFMSGSYLIPPEDFPRK